MREKRYMIIMDAGEVFDRNLTLKEANKLKREYNADPDIREMGTCEVEIDEDYCPAIASALTELNKAVFD